VAHAGANVINDYDDSRRPPAGAAPDDRPRLLLAATLALIG
jgi:hypothetical protein